MTKLIYIYIFANWGLSVTDAPFKHFLYPDVTPQAVYNAQQCIEPTFKHSKNHIPTIGDTVYVNHLIDTADVNGGAWFVILPSEVLK
jgi:hypothetical protein